MTANNDRAASKTADATTTAALSPQPAAAAKPKTKRALLWAFLLLLVVVVFLMMSEDTIDVTRKDTPPPLQLVSVETVTAAPTTARIGAFAEVRPRWTAELRAAVGGRVLGVSDHALTGARVMADTQLIDIEDSAYQAELAAADYELAQARLSFRKAQNNTAIKRREFERAGTKPPSDLALHLPELKIAERAVESAEARVAAAQQKVTDATITAPFSGFVTARMVSPGQTVYAGDALLKLVDDTTYELTVDIGARDWRLLSFPLTGQKADIFKDGNTPVAQAVVRGGGGFLDETTRQNKVFLEVTSDAANGLLSGDFVRVVLTGKTVERALTVPESAITQEGYLWHLDTNDRLVRLQPDVLFRSRGQAVIEAPVGLDTLRIARTPLASFLPGQKVRPQGTEG